MSSFKPQIYDAMINDTIQTVLRKSKRFRKKYREFFAHFDEFYKILYFHRTLTGQPAHARAGYSTIV